MERVILSLDIGTSSSKAVLLTETGRQIGSAKSHYALHHTSGRMYVEQDPEEIWRGVCSAIGQLSRTTSQFADVQAIALSGQISSHFFVDHLGRPLTNIMTWMDSRAAEEAKEMRAAFSPNELLKGLGADIPVGPSWPAPKLRWTAKNTPRVLDKAQFLVQPKDWILWKLTSVWKTDLSSLRGLVHQVTGKPFDKLMQWTGAMSSILPSVGDPFEIMGTVEPQVADSLGLPANLPVVLGWNDLNTSVLGTVGLATEEVLGFDMTGTSEHIGIVDSRHTVPSSPGASGVTWIPILDTHALQYGVTSSGGQAMKWFVEQIDQPGRTTRDYDFVFEQAQEVTAGAEGLVFLPYLAGERSPWWDSDARGAFFGLHLQHDRRHMARAVMEGVGFALRSIFDRLAQRPKNIVISGGLSHVSHWNQIKADILGVPLIQTASQEAGCLGAAVLASCGLGWYRTLSEACTAMLHTGQVLEPRRLDNEIYEEGYSIFLQLYHALQPLHARRSGARTESESI